MKLIRFGTEANEKPGIQLENKRIDVSAFREDYNKVFNIYRAIDPSLTGTIDDEPIETITKRIDNPLYNLVDQVPEHHRNDVKIRLEAMIVGFGIKPRNQQATIYNVGSTSMA